MIKEVKDLYAENYKTFIQEIEDDSLKMIQRNGKIFYALGRINKYILNPQLRSLESCFLLTSAGPLTAIKPRGLSPIFVE